MSKRVIFNCNKCGKCCMNWDITITKDDILKIKKLGFAQYEFVDIKNNQPTLRFNMNKCVFLDSDSSCIIQNEFGFEKKPDVCKDFPYEDYICGNPIYTSKKKDLKN